MTTKQQIKDILENRIMVLDGAMGTALQKYRLEEADFRGNIFESHHLPLKGNNDLLSITRPDIVKKIHEAYFEAGADFATTNSFSGTTIAQADYELEEAVYQINYAAAQCARQAADEYSKLTPQQPRFVVGAMGPINRTASVSQDINDPGKRAINFDDLKDAYYAQAKALIEGGADLIMIETIFDTLNSKSAIVAIKELEEELNIEVPIMASATITEASGRTLTGQTIDAFYVSIKHGDLLSVGLNCAMGAKEMHQYISRLASITKIPVSAHPNAGLPNEIGEYEESAESMARDIEAFVKNGDVKIIGGCCGTTPEHIRAFKKIADRYQLSIS